MVLFVDLSLLVNMAGLTWETSPLGAFLLTWYPAHNDDHRRHRLVEPSCVATMADSASDLASIIQEREVQLVWRRGFSTSTVLFFGVRYPAVFSTIFVVMDMTSWKGMSDWEFADQISIISEYTFTRMEPVNYTFPSPACGFNSTISNTDYENHVIRVGIHTPPFSWMIGGRLSSVLADVLVLIATWTRTRPMRVEASKINFTARFAAILMRDGTLYFVVLLVANLIGLGLARRIELIEPMSTWIALSLLTESGLNDRVTAIFTSRFIIDLHEAADTLSREDTTQLTEFGTLETIAFHVDSRLAHTQHGSSASRSVYGAVLTDLSMTTEWNDSDESQGPPDMPKDKPSFEMELVGVAV
ncbi:hypothetical protein ACG7TL_009144 [Trametes sanguinea]